MDTFRSFKKPIKIVETKLDKVIRYQKGLTLKKLIKLKEQMDKFKGDPSKILVLRPKKKVVKKKRILLPSIRKLEARLKRVMYPYIKKRDGNFCISCQKRNLVGMDWHAGHYIKAELCNMVARYDEYNINSQCSNCNLWKRGNTIAYRFAMIAKYGLFVVETLERLYNEPLPMNFNHREWLLGRIELYKNKNENKS